MSSFDETAASLPITEFAFPGPLRDELNAAILAGDKTSTTSLLAEYEGDDDALPTVGQHYQLIDSNQRPIAIVEVTSVRITRLADVDLQHAKDEGEGFQSVEHWRRVHEQYWSGSEFVAHVGSLRTLRDDEMVVLERFRVIEVRPT